MSLKKLPSLSFFIPFYGMYRTVVRLRKSEEMLNSIKSELNYLQEIVDRRHKEVQYYEARIDSIYQRIMSSFPINPSDARIQKNKPDRMS